MTSDTGTVVLAYDGSAGAKHAVASVAGLLPGHRVRVLSAWRSIRESTRATRLALPDDVIEGGVAELDGAAMGEAHRLAEDGAELARAAGLDATSAAVEAESAIETAILRAAEDEHAAAVAVGSRGRSGMKAALLGSVSRAVLHHAKLPVMVAPPAEPESAAGPVVIGFDGSADAEAAVRATAALIPDREMVVVHAWQPVNQAALAAGSGDSFAVSQAQELSRDLDRAGETEAEEMAEAGAAIARDAGARAGAAAVRADDGAWRALVDEADRRGAALVAVGSRGRSRTASMLLGSVSAGVVGHAGRPVLVVPPAA